MADITKRTYSRIACRMCRVRRRYSELEDKVACHLQIYFSKV